MTDSAVPVTLSLTEIHQDFVDDPDDDFVHISIDHVTLSRQLDGGVNDALRPFHADITVHHGYILRCLRHRSYRRIHRPVGLWDRPRGGW